MASCPLDLCCSESSSAISAMGTPNHCFTPSSVSQHPTKPGQALSHAPGTNLLSDNQGIREELMVLLEREQKGPRIWNYLLSHNVFTSEARAVLVAAISSVSFFMCCLPSWHQDVSCTCGEQVACCNSACCDRGKHRLKCSNRNGYILQPVGFTNI